MPCQRTNALVETALSDMLELTTNLTHLSLLTYHLHQKPILISGVLLE